VANFSPELVSAEPLSSRLASSYGPQKKYVISYNIPTSLCRGLSSVRLESIHIKNFRAVKDQTVKFSDYTCLVGPNGAGKSTILIALCVLFRYSTDSTTNLLVLDKEDFHQKNTDEDVEITATFTDLNEDAQKKLAHYYRQDKLVVSAVAKWNKETNSAPVVQYGKREVMKAFVPFFKAHDDSKVKVDDLRKLYAGCKQAIPALPAETTKAAMYAGLRAYEEAHPQDCTLVNSQDEFYGGAGKAQNLLAQFIQWEYVAAVKDATTEQLEARKTVLGRILERTVRLKMALNEPLERLRDEAYERYSKLLKEHEKELRDLGASLTARMSDWAHPDARIKLEWRDDESQVSIADPLAKVKAAEGTFEGDLPRFGHGFQRSFLLALLQELVIIGATGGPKLILACEEPELYQHPPQIRHLASVFDALTEQGTQVLVCTHNPLFIRGENFEEIRFVAKDRQKGHAEVRHLRFDDVAERIEKAGGERPKKLEGTALRVSQALKPNINEMFFTSVLVLVEGLEDAAYISTQLVLRNSWTEFRRLGGHIVICDGKGKMLMPLAIARGLKLPTFVVFDADLSHQTKPDKGKHEKDNKMLMELCGHTGKPEWPTDTIWEANMVVWSEHIANAIEHHFGTAEWQKLCDASKKKQGVHDQADIFKCESYIQSLMSDLWDQKKISRSLETLCEKLIAFAKQMGIGSIVSFKSAGVQDAEPDAAAPANVEAAPGTTKVA
jgi:putative ATP-dependent endonuclease of OLD family